MAEQTHVDVDLLERASTLLISHLREQVGSEVLLEFDYFWSVPVGELHDVYREPTKLTIGQVTECMDSLRDVVQEPERALAYHLVWLGDVLKAVGQSVLK